MTPIALALACIAAAHAGATPTAVDDVAEVVEGESVVVPVLANDADSDSALTYARVQIIGTPLNGWAYVKSTGSAPLGVVFTHDASETAFGEFEYRVGDGETWSAPATARIDVLPVDDPPVAVADEFDIEERETRTFAVLDNDIDDDSTLTYDNVELIGIPFYGTAVVTPSGVAFTHDGTEGVIASFRYRLRDASYVSEEVTVHITVLPTNNPPIAVADEATIDEDETAIIPVLDNDTDAEQTLGYEGVRIVEAFGGTAEVGPDGVAFTPGPGIETVGGFTYVVNDGFDDSNVAGVGVTIVRRNDPPVASDDQEVFFEGEGRSILVLANDTDPDNVLDYHNVSIVGTPVNGRVVLGGFGVGFAHDGSETTSASFQYTVHDGEHVSEPATVQITVLPVNDPPIARRDTATVVEGGQVHIPVLANDEDADDPRLYNLTWVVGAPFRGTTEVVDDGIVFTHDGGEIDDAEFYYRFTDGLVESDLAQVWITVVPVNDAPVAHDDRGSTYSGSTIDMAVLGNDVDPDSNLEYDRIEIVGTPQHGTAEVVGNRVRFTHDGSRERFARFRYRVSDGEVMSNIASAILWIRPEGHDGGGLVDWPEVCDDTDCDTGIAGDSEADATNERSGCDSTASGIPFVPWILLAAMRRRPRSATTN